MPEPAKVPSQYALVKKGDNGLQKLLSEIKSRSQTQVLILGQGVGVYYSNRETFSSALGERWDFSFPPMRQHGNKISKASLDSRRRSRKTPPPPASGSSSPRRISSKGTCFCLRNPVPIQQRYTSWDYPNRPFWIWSITGRSCFDRISNPPGWNASFPATTISCA